MRVLVGIDESECSSAAIRFIGESAWPTGTEFIVLSTSSPVLGPGEALPPYTVTEMLRQEEVRCGEIAQRAAIRLRRAGLSAEGRTIRANAQTALVDTARSEKADLVIVGSHGRTGLKKLFLGSVASHVVAHAPCSVLVVKQPHARSSKTSARKPETEKATKVGQLT